MHPTVTYLLERIADTRAAMSQRGGRSAWGRQDLQAITLEVAAFVGPVLDVARLEQDLVAEARRDHAALARATSWFEGVERAPPKLRAVGSEPYLDMWSERLDALRELSGALAASPGLDPEEVTLRLSLIGDSAFERLLMILDPSEETVRSKLKKIVAKKLLLLKPAERAEYWGRLRLELDSSQELFIPVVPEVLPEECYRFGSPDEAAALIADYLVRARPLLVREAIRSGQTSFPWRSAGIATVLSWTSPQSGARRPLWLTTAIRSIRRIVYLTDRSEELGEMWGLKKEGYFLGRGYEDEERAATADDGDIPTRTLDELTTLLRVGGRAAQIPLERAERILLAYKDGLEVAQQDLPAAYRKRREERHQREICRFLVERELRAYGTSFGRGRVDVRVEDPPHVFVVEAKRVVDRNFPTRAVIDRWLTQLGWYMDQDRPAFHGVLALYNFSSRPIFVPKLRVKEKFLIVAVNLCKHSPSKSAGGVTIHEGTGNHLVRLEESAEPPARSVPPRRRVRTVTGGRPRRRR